MFVQETKSKRGNKTYFSYLVREAFRTPQGPRSRTVCNISKLPPHLRDMVAAALAGKPLVAHEDIQLKQALDCGGLAVLDDAWKQFELDRLLRNMGTLRQRSLIKAMIFSRLLFPCAKLALKERAQGTLLASACGLPQDEPFDEDELYVAMDAISGHWSALEQQMAITSFKKPLSLVLYDLTSVYFEGKGPHKFSRYGHSRDHRGDRPQIILAVATDRRGGPLHLSVLRGNRADTTTLQGFLKILRRRFCVEEAVFAFDGGMSSKVNLKTIEAAGLKFVTRLANTTLESLLKQLPSDKQLQLGDRDKLVEIQHDGKRYVIAGGPWRRQRDYERRTARIIKGQEALTNIAAVKRKRPNPQKIASQAGLKLQTLKAHKYFNYHVDPKGILQWSRKEDIIETERAHDGFYLLHTNLLEAEAAACRVQGHYKNLLEVEEAFCELKSYLRVRPVFHYRPERVINHVRICFLAYWISARLATQWRQREETGEVTRILRQLQTIRVGQIQTGRNEYLPLVRFTQVSPELNDLLSKLGLLHLFASPPRWAQQTHP